MKTIYIDADYKCYNSNSDGTLLEIKTDFFDGKCDTFIEGYRFVPFGNIWARSDGVVFHGEMAAPWKPWEELDAAQRAYERELVSQLQTENATLISDMAQMIDEVYRSDLEMMGI